MPDADTSTAISLQIPYSDTDFDNASGFMQFTAAIASFGMVLNNSEYKGDTSYEAIVDWLDMANLSDEHGFKEELKMIVLEASDL